MIELRDSIIIDVSPERVWAFLKDLPRHYREWHPDHVVCRYERGESLQVGAVLYFEEYLHGRPHGLRLRATEVVPGRLVRYSDHGYRGAFVLEPAAGGTRFTAELSFGTRVPGVGKVIDAILRRLLRSRLIALQTHMREEGQNLKRLLEREASA